MSLQDRLQGLDDGDRIPVRGQVIIPERPHGLKPFETPPGQAVSVTAFVFLFYIPLGYYTDQFIYRRRVKQEARKPSKTR